MVTNEEESERIQQRLSELWILSWIFGVRRQNMSSVAEMFNMSKDESIQIARRLAELTSKYGTDEEGIKPIVHEILEEPDIRTREIMLFTFALAMEA